jgi:hypothetical protein
MSAAEGSTFIFRELSTREVRTEKPELSGSGGECFHGSPTPSAGDAGFLRGITDYPIVRRAKGQLGMAVSGTRVGL